MRVDAALRLVVQLERQHWLRIVWLHWVGRHRRCCHPGNQAKGPGHWSTQAHNCAAADASTPGAAADFGTWCSGRRLGTWCSGRRLGTWCSGTTDTAASRRTAPGSDHMHGKGGSVPAHRSMARVGVLPEGVFGLPEDTPIPIFARGCASEPRFGAAYGPRIRGIEGEAREK
jgi:hypothetical protein